MCFQTRTSYLPWDRFKKARACQKPITTQKTLVPLSPLEIAYRRLV
jgi:hypothetical protein